MALLSKVSDSNYPSNGMPNERALKCPNCEQSYRLVFGELEAYFLGAWLMKADAVLRRSHKRNNHATEVLKLD
jgi:hypothetical protein